ncbi:FliH/SctL family protein [Duganella radicis]|uniref:Flagellar assembly protein FliH n=1 Tax=Duganella radicis TaxID=551988 RepID=A0A6L6PS37_9BURK|nr:FliH/SctL family protein [Duganella radicis]MTV41457.1 hypothetical protein [Duganella radicis]
MAAIIPAAALSGASRQLRRPGAAAVVAVPAAVIASPPSAPVASPVIAPPPSAPVAPPVITPPPPPAPVAPPVITPPPPPAPVAPQPSDLQRQAVLLDEQAEALRLRAQALTTAEAELDQRQAELERREQQLQAGQRELAEEAAAIKADAERRGLAQGQQQGEREAQEAVRGQVERLSGVVRALQQSKRTLLEENQDMLVEIAFAAVCRVLGTQLVSRDGIAAMVGGLVDGEHALDRITVRLHLRDAELMTAEAGDADPRLMFQADAGIELGGCIVDSPRGTLDARLELQLHQLRAALADVRRQQSKSEAPI